MKILVTGGKGQLGDALQKVIGIRDTLYTDSDDMDITDLAQIEKNFTGFKPDWLIHGAAFTDVDGAETKKEIAELINVQGTKNLVEACRKHEVKMVYISTDYVFDGTKTKPYLPEDKTNPKSVYGNTKLEGERAVRVLLSGYIVRTQWLYGKGHNFVRTMLDLADKMDKIKVVGDQYGRPTAAIDLSKAIADIVQKQPKPGTYHISGDGPVVSWAQFAEKIFKISGKKVKVVPITTKEYLAGQTGRTIATRPAHSALNLDKTKAAKIFLSDWTRSLRVYLK